MMIPDPTLVHYACVAKDSIILAEMNSKHADLGSIALKCLEKAPQFHTFFSHTVRNRTYMFLIDEPPFVFFAILDSKADNNDALSFLRAIRHAFRDLPRRLDKLHSHCFQGELNPVFHQLLDSHIRMPLLDLKMKKKRFRRSNNDDDVSNHGSREFSVVMHKNVDNQMKANKVWKKQVWVVLSLDLIVCTILFIVWLCVCRGFKCIHA